MVRFIFNLFRFIFLFLQTVAHLFNAQHARLGYRSYQTGFHSLSIIISALFRSIFFRYQAMSYAMSARNIEQFIIPQHFLPEKSWDHKLTLIAGGFLIGGIALIV